MRAEKLFKSFLDHVSQEATLFPPSLAKEIFEDSQFLPGIFILRMKREKPLFYVG